MCDHPTELGSAQDYAYGRIELPLGGGAAQF
jgi:hypothetical protein